MSALMAALGAAGSEMLGAAAGALGGGLVSKVLHPDDTKEFDPYEVKEWMDILYPGTSPWERLGASGASAATSAGATQSKTSQETLAKMRSGSAQNVSGLLQTMMTTDAQKESAGISVSPANRMADIAEYKAGQELANLEENQKLLIQQQATEAAKQMQSIASASYMTEQQKGQAISNIIQQAVADLAEDKALKDIAPSSLYQMIDVGINRVNRQISDLSEGLTESGRDLYRMFNNWRHGSRGASGSW